MRIGLDCRLWDESGVGRYIRNLVVNLLEIDKHNEYELFVLSKDLNNIKNQISKIKYQTRWKIVLADVRWHSIGEQVTFLQILNKENLDLVHFPYFSVPIFYKRPFVITIHDLILHHFPTGEASTHPYPIYWLKHQGYKFVIKQAAKKAKHIVTISNATKRDIMQSLHVPAEKISVTHAGIDMHISIKISKPSISKKYFLHVGNLYPHKNMKRFLDAFGKVQREGNVKLAIVGKEDYFYQSFKELVRKKNLEHAVLFYGEVLDEKLANLYQHALSVVIPSLIEGFGLPAVEAMSKGTLVLASDIPSLREICDNAAVYFDPRNVRAIEEKLREVCFNDLNHFSKKRSIGLERAKLFSWEKMARLTLRVYESVFE